MARKKKNRGAANQDSDDDFPDITASQQPQQSQAPPSPQAQTPKGNKKNRRKAASAAAAAAQQSDDEDILAKMAAEMNLSGSEKAEPSPQQPRKKSPKNKRRNKGRGKQQQLVESDDDDEDTDIMAKMQAEMEQETNSKPTASKFAMLDDDTESDEPVSQPQKSKFDMLDSEKSEEESEKPPSPSQTRKGKKGKKKKKDLDENGEEDPTGSPKSKKKGKKGKKNKENGDAAEAEKDTSKTKPAVSKYAMFSQANKALADVEDDDEEDVSQPEQPTTAQTPTEPQEENNTTDNQQFTHDDAPIAVDLNAFQELTDEQYIALSKKDKRKYMRDLETNRIEQQNAEVAEVAMGTSSLQNFAVSQRRDDGAKLNQQDLSNDIKIEQFSIAAKGKKLYDNADLRIIHGRKYGLIGPNGKGKTTLLRCIAAKALRIPAHIDLLYCEQEVQADETPAIDVVLNADKIRKGLLAKEKKLLSDQDNGIEIDIKELAKVYDDMKIHGVDKAESKARRILAGLGFTVEMQKRATQDFSGGWRMRVSIARALFLEPTLLMLDEPTNHLDLNAVIWLNNYLVAWKKTLLIVSHDQQFLDDVCSDVVHLDQLKLKYYRGNYSDWKAQYQIHLAESQKAYEKQEKRLKELKTKGTSKKKAEAKQKEALTRKQQKGRVAKKDMMQDSSSNQQELISRPREYAVDFTFPNPPQLNPPVLGLYDVEFAYPGQAPLFKNVEFGVDMDSRISIVGPNGVGKSTLLKLLLNEVKPTLGECRRNHRLRTAYYSQHSAEYLPLEKTPVDYLRGKYDPDVDYQFARKLLGNCGLEGHAHVIPIADLSGGQKARVALAELICSAPDIIILDEPTNNLDIESIDALGLAINNYEGGVVIVSHDARLITETDCQLWVVEDQNIIKVDGGFQDYKQQIMDELDERMANYKA